MNLNTALTLIVTVCLALIGYLYTLFLARRKDRLKRISRQLSDLYGPLYALSSTGAHVWTSFRSQHRPHKGSFWKPGSPVDDKDADAFRLWIRSVLMPLNRQMMELVVNRADLLEGTEIPDCLLDLCAHISSYEALLVQWEKGDHTGQRFPRDGQHAVDVDQHPADAPHAPTITAAAAPANAPPGTIRRLGHMRSRPDLAGCALVGDYHPPRLSLVAVPRMGSLRCSPWGWSRRLTTRFPRRMPSSGPCGTSLPHDAVPGCLPGPFPRSTSWCCGSAGAR